MFTNSKLFSGSILIKRTVLAPSVDVASVIMNVQNYSTFVPFCTHSEILEPKESDVSFIAKLSIKLGPIERCYKSHVELQKDLLMPTSSVIVATAIDSPFSELKAVWSVTEIMRCTTSVVVKIDYSTTNFGLFLLTKTSLPTITNPIINSFLECFKN